MRIDLNSDLGEGFGIWRLGDDAAMLGIVSTANIACGLHAGDPETMRATVETARSQGVAVGAHPGYADIAGFGRRPMPGVGAGEVENLVAYQVGALAGICALAGHPMTHVKTHGALANACVNDQGLADAVARAVRAVDPGLALMTMPGTATDRSADRAGLRPIREIYADRTYDDSFKLTSRSKPGSTVHDPQLALERVMRMVSERRLTSVTGKVLAVEIDSICVHGDNPAAVEMARILRAGLEGAGWTVAGAAPSY